MKIGTVDTFSYLEAIDWYLKNNVECAKNLQKQHAHLSGLLDTRTTCSLSNLYYDIPVLEEINPSDTIPPVCFFCIFFILFIYIYKFVCKFSIVVN